MAQILTNLADLQARLGRPEAPETARLALAALEATLGADHPITQQATPELQRIASGGGSAQDEAAQIASLANQVRDGAIAAIRGETERDPLIARIEAVAVQAAEGEVEGSPWNDLALYLRAVVALLRREPVPEAPAAYAEHLAAIEAAREEGGPGSGA